MADGHVINVYVSTSPGSLDKKKKMERVVTVLQTLSARLGYTLETIDIANLENKDAKEFMMSNGQADEKGAVVAPQIFNGNKLCGGYQNFDFAVEDENLKEFLQLDS